MPEKEIAMKRGKKTSQSGYGAPSFRKKTESQLNSCRPSKVDFDGDVIFEPVT